MCLHGAQGVRQACCPHCDWSVLYRITLCFLPSLWWLAEHLGTKVSGPCSLKPSDTISDSWHMFAKSTPALSLSATLPSRSLQPKIEALTLTQW